MAYGGANFVLIVVPRSSVPKSFKEMSDLHYVECQGKDEQLQQYLEFLLDVI